MTYHVKIINWRLTQSTECFLVMLITWFHPHPCQDPGPKRRTRRWWTWWRSTDPSAGPSLPSTSRVALGSSAGSAGTTISTRRLRRQPGRRKRWTVFYYIAVFLIRVSISSVNSYPDSVYGSRRAKMAHKNREKKLGNFMLWSAGCSLSRAEGFFWGLGIGKLQFLIKKNIKFFFSCTFFQFSVIKTLDPDGYSA